MAQGKKYNDDVKERAFALLACNNSVAYVAKELDLPYSTVKTWEKNFLAQSEALAQQEKGQDDGSLSDEVAKSNDELDLAKLRKKKKEEFVASAWGLISKCETLIERRLTRALESEKAIDELCEMLAGEVTPEKKKAIYAKFSTIKIENVKDLAVILGTLYDKQALANKEPTSIVDGELSVKKFEDL